MLPDGSSFCNECGCRIGKRMRASLCEDQPAAGPARTARSPRTVRREALVVAGTVLSLAMAASLLLEWLSPGMSGLDLATDASYAGRRLGVLRFAPLAVAVLGVALTIHFAFGVIPRSWVFPLGIVCSALTVMFCAEFGWGSAYSAGAGAYIAVLSSATVAMLGLREIGN